MTRSSLPTARRLAIVVLVGLCVNSSVVSAGEACCSQEHQNCASWGGNTPEICATNDNGKMVWLPDGPESGCSNRWSSAQCTEHADCCGMLVCDGKSWNIADKRCTHPVDLCSTFTDETFCNTRSSCEWNSGACKPNFDYSVKIEANRPLDIPDDPACCSANHRECPNWTPKSEQECRDLVDDQGRNKEYIWMPEGPLESCVSHWDSDKTCDVHSDCCAGLVCEVHSNDRTKKQCKLPVWVCKDFSDNEWFCNTRSSCMWENDECVPNFDTRTYDKTLIIEDREEDPGCCSPEHGTCPNWAPKGPEACKAAVWEDGNASHMVWLPEGPFDEGTCGNRWENADCELHSDCCGMLVCDGYAWKVEEKKCRHPVDLCKSYTDESFCLTRSSCHWENEQCIPNFEDDVYDPSLKPEDWQDDPGCCSQNHLECSGWGAKTHDLCKAQGDGKMVWIPDGDKQVPNADTCLKRWETDSCESHTDCCGNLICAPLPWNALKLQCQHPLDVCAKEKASQFCELAPGCTWADNECVPEFDYSVVEPQILEALPAPAKIRAANDGNADYLGLCEGYVGSAHGDPHFTTFDRQNYDCMATGAFTLVEAPGLINVQGMLHKNNPTSHASVLVGVAMEYPALPGVPDIQVSYAEYDSGEDTTFWFNDECPAHVYINGELQQVARGTAISGDNYVIIINNWGGVDIQFFDGDAGTTAIRVIGYGKQNDALGCMMTAKICLPLNEPEVLNNAKGLLGTPNGNTEDEWLLPGGETLPLKRYGQEPYDFCTQNYCIASEADSLFVYEEITHEDRYSCSVEFPGEPDLSEVPEEVAELCGEDRDCLLEGLIGGIEGATRNIETEREISEIATTPELKPENEFHVPEVLVEPKATHYVCPTTENLGPALSASSGYTDPFPLLGTPSDLDNPQGREDEIGFLVGGNYYAPLAAEIEGNIVVMGDFIIGDKGTNSLGWAGVGSGIFPNEGVFMKVGGDLDGGKSDGETWAMTKGSIEYGGSCLSTPANTRAGSYPDERACGSLFVSNGASLTQTALDKTPYEDMFAELQAKSEFWYNLPANGVFEPFGQGPDTQHMVWKAGDDNCLQVFKFEQADLVNQWNIKMDPSLEGKTILINISPYDADGNLGEVTVDNIGKFLDPFGGNDRTFSSVTKQSMLWNFHGATKVTLGPGAGIQFPGSILIPSGDLDMLWPGQDGRTIVYGDVFHNDHGSEFHNYEFDPPCPLPLPACPGGNEYCIGNGIMVVQEEISVPLPEGAFTSANGDGTTVDFTVTQNWKEGEIISWIAPVYRQPGGDDHSCVEGDKVESFQDGASSTYTAECNADGIAKVILFVHDGSFKESSAENIHGCNGWGNNNGIATYTFEVPCSGDALCEGEPTAAPVPATATSAPTQAPIATASPTKAPVATPGPTAAPVATPVPTRAPVTEAPIPNSSTEAPTGSPIETPPPKNVVATPAPTNTPATPAPFPQTGTASPTGAPIVVASTVPPTQPEEIPTRPPSSDCPYELPGASECPEDVQILGEERVTSFAYDIPNPITIVSQDNDFVTFNISNPFDETIQAMYYQFPDGSAGATECLASKNLGTCEPVTVTAHCVAGRDSDHAFTTPFAVVDVWFVDPTAVSPIDNDVVPQCCQPDEVDQQSNAVMYTLKINCESKCPVTGEVTRTRGAVIPTRHLLRGADISI